MKENKLQNKIKELQEDILEAKFNHWENIRKFKECELKGQLKIGDFV